MFLFVTTNAFCHLLLIKNKSTMNSITKDSKSDNEKVKLKLQPYKHKVALYRLFV